MVRCWMLLFCSVRLGVGGDTSLNVLLGLPVVNELPGALLNQWFTNPAAVSIRKGCGGKLLSAPSCCVQFVECHGQYTCRTLQL